VGLPANTLPEYDAGEGGGVDKCTNCGTEMTTGGA
jgi:hypothetical protein